MNVHVFHAPPPAELGAALEEFEAQFRYPLGESQSFSISHGRDYITFFAAIGEPTLVAAEHRGRILGTLSAALRTLRFPDGTEQRVAYLGDLKIAPDSRGGVVLARIMETMFRDLSVPANGTAYGVVMDGTNRIPSEYTGRVGVPAFSKLGSLCILKANTAGCAERVRGVEGIASTEWAKIYALIAPGGFLPRGGNPTLRSTMTPRHLASASRNAVGRIEDTRLAKRLFISPENEIRAAHLTGFAFAVAADGAELFRHAAAVCTEQNIPTLFASVPQSSAAAIQTAMGNADVQFVTATVFGCGLGAGDWWVDTAEI